MKFLLMAVGVLVPSFAFAADVGIPVDSFEAFFASVGGWVGMGVLGIAMAVAQLVLLLANKIFLNFSGPAKLLLVSGVTMLIGFLGLKLTGADWMGALAHPATIASAQVFIHQIIKQIQGGK